jgi:Lar family restriction alleviation protein
MNDRSINYRLIPCPFCGNTKSVSLVRKKEYKDQFAVNCDARYNGCGATSGYAFGEAAAIANWNTRSTSRAPSVKLDAFQKAELIA